MSGHCHYKIINVSKLERNFVMGSYLYINECTFAPL